MENSRCSFSAARLANWLTQQASEQLDTRVQHHAQRLGLKPKLAFGPVRVAVTGRRISPPLFESMELLGRDRAMTRIDAALARTPWQPYAIAAMATYVGVVIESFVIDSDRHQIYGGPSDFVGWQAGRVI